MSKLAWIALSVVGLVLLVACSPGGGPVVTAVTIDEGDQVLAVGASVQLTATVAASGGASTAVTWSSSSDAAAVGANGLITAVIEGEATITATSVADDTKSASVEVSVVPAPVVTVAADVAGLGFTLAQEAAERFMAMHPGVIVHVLDTPELAADRLGYYLDVFEAESSAIDVAQIDVIWPGDLAEHLVDLFDYGASDIIGEHFPAIVESNTAQGRLVAVPWFVDAGLLYYRTDLLAKYAYDGPPATWSALTEMAQVIQDGERADGNADFWGFVWQGNAYEGLTCNALEWIASNAGGSVIEPDGTITVNNANAIEIVDLAASWVGTISPPDVTAFAEEDTRAIWQAGNAAFLRNWPYAYTLGQNPGSPIAGLFGVGSLPAGSAAGSAPAATLGGFQLAVSRYSEHPDLAATVALFLASYEEQKIRAIEGSVSPTIMALYEDDDVLAAVPILASFFDAYVNAVARPSTVSAPQYVAVSTAFFSAVHSVLTGTQGAADAFESLADDLQALTGFPTGAP